MSWTRGRTIGHGSTATVSLAVSSQSPGDFFAVKSAELSQSEFLQKEQQILSSLTSPYVVRYRGCDVTEENQKVMYNILLEYMPNGSVVDCLQVHGGRLDECLIRLYTRQVVQGLLYLHFNGLVHCDIKGRNILIGEDGAKIADFGCARRVTGEEKVSALPRFGGTPMFMAPEVARGEEQGFASDIWSLGCTIIEMAGGSPWPNVKDPVSVLYQVGYSGRLPEVPGWLSEEGKDFLDRCLSRDPKQRWTAAELLKHPFLGGESNSHGKQIQESNSNSPTSILDHGFWNSVDDESENLCNWVHQSAETSDDDERIRRLSSSGGPSWDSDQNWMTVRENWRCREEVEARNQMTSSSSSSSDVSDEEELLSLLDCKISSRISTKDSFVISNLRLDDILLPPPISRLILQS